MLQYERTNAVVSLTLIGLALYFVLEFPTRVTSIPLFGTPLGINASRRWLMILILVGVVMAGADMVVRSQPALLQRRLSYLATFWVLPGLLVVAATQTLGFAPSPLVWGLSLAGVGLLLWLTIVAAFHQASDRTDAPRWAFLWEQFIGYALALTLFTLIYQIRSRSLLSAGAVLLISGLIALPLLRQNKRLISKIWLFASVIALIVGQMTGVLNLLQIGALQAGLILFLTFYLLVGLAQQHLLNKLSYRVLQEYALLAAIALVAIYFL